MALLIVGTYRDSELSRRHPLARSLSELAKEHLYDPIQLRGLRPPHVSAFLAARTGIAPPHSLVDAVWQQTEGNPLFLTELVRLMEQDGTLASDRLRGGEFVLPVRIPEGVREVIGHRLDRLPDACNKVLRVASVIGREFESDLLQRLLPDLERGRIEDAVETALAPGVVEVVLGAPRRYRFTHVLVQKTLSDELTTGELSYHLGEAGASDTAKLVTYCRLAGQQALGVHGYEEAVIHFERASTTSRPETWPKRSKSLCCHTIRWPVSRPDRLRCSSGP